MIGYRLYYTDPTGNVYTVADGNIRRIAKGGLHGFGMMKASVAGVRRPYRSGELFLGNPYTPPRELSVGIEITRGSWDLFQQEIADRVTDWNPYKAPDKLGVLTLENATSGNRRAIDCLLCEVPDPEMSGPVGGVLEMHWYAPFPFFYDPVEKSQVFGLGSPGGVAFPIEFAGGGTPGVTFSTSSVDSRITVANVGHIETWGRIRVNGPGDNPVIENETTGKTMALTAGGGLSLDSGDCVDVDMNSATVKFFDASVGTMTDINEKMSDASEFWPLVPGGNTLHCTMSNVTTGSIIVYWYNYYLVGWVR